MRHARGPSTGSYVYKPGPALGDRRRSGAGSGLLKLQGNSVGEHPICSELDAQHLKPGPQINYPIFSLEACPLQRVSSDPPTPRWIDTQTHGCRVSMETRQGLGEKFAGVFLSRGDEGGAAVSWDLLEPDGTHDSPRWNGSCMSDTLLSGYTAFPSSPSPK